MGKKIGILTLTIFALFFGCSKKITVNEEEKSVSKTKTDIFFEEPLKEGEISVMRFTDNSSSMIIRTIGKSILIDPGFLMENELSFLDNHPIDLLIYSHEHGDHFHPDSTKIILSKINCPVVGEKAVIAELKKVYPDNKLISAEPGESYEISGITLDTVEGIHPCPIVVFRIHMDGITIFHGADTNYIPLSDYTSDLAFLPTGYPSPSCSPEAAFKMAADLKPKIVVPMHGRLSQEKKLVELIKTNLPGTEVFLTEPYQKQKFVLK